MGLAMQPDQEVVLPAAEADALRGNRLAARAFVLCVVQPLATTSNWLGRFGAAWDLAGLAAVFRNPCEPSSTQMPWRARLLTMAQPLGSTGIGCPAPPPHGGLD